jgi:osmotically-inducible protein OsmY
MDAAFHIASAAALASMLVACGMQPDVDNASGAQAGAEATGLRDDALAEKVRRKLTSGGAPAQSIGVEVTASRGVVSLHGAVESPGARKRLALAAASVGGVKAVDNQLRVYPPGDTASGQ